MPATVTGNVHNLNESRVQALRALEHVSDRLGDILGDISGDGTHRNENGELVNEDGLPIIDITEPIDDLDTPSLSAATQEDEVLEDNYPEPISKLSAEALALSRRHRDKILDLLEEEESRETRRTQQEKQAELRRRREAARSEMEKRMVTQGMELEKRRRAKEIEKKMAKALVSGLGSPEPAANTKAGATSFNPKKKSVTFADPPSVSQASSSKTQENMEAVEWENAIPGRLSEKRLASRSRSQPMKMEVIERPPAAKPSHSEPTPSLSDTPISRNPIGDSDDESDAEEHSDPNSAFEAGDEDFVLSAQHHRELALEYHRRRNAVASSAGTVQSEDIDTGIAKQIAISNDWDKEDVPLEATLAHPPPKPSVSKFKTALTNAKSESAHRPLGTPSESRNAGPTYAFGASVLPPGALARSIKMGKLVDDKLVAGHEEEEEEEREAREEEEIRKLLLKSMENYSGVAARVMGPAGPYLGKSQAKTADSSGNSQPPSKAKAGPKVSRFKVNRIQSRGRSEATASSRAPSGLPLSTSIDKEPFVTYDSATPSSSILAPDAVIDSPSFPATIIESPSFAGSTGPAAPTSQSQPSQLTPNIFFTPPAYPVERQSTAMADSVAERVINRSSLASATEITPRKVSRFKAERSRA